MTPMQRIDKELERRNLRWPALQEALGGASKQSVTNWRKKGFPTKHYTKTDEFFGKPYGWTEYGTEPKEADKLAPNPSRLEAAMASIAAMFRSIPEDEWGDALMDVSAVLQKRNHFR